MAKADNIILIGMPGAGKSTIGRLLAERLGYAFMDSDNLICEREGRSLSRIIEEGGLENFLRIEEEVNAGIQAEKSVIATGGSVIYGVRAMEHLGKSGKIVYLRLSCPELERRLSDLKGRGVAIREGLTFRDLYEERTPLYERYADIVVDLDGKDTEGALSVLTEKLEQRPEL